MLSYQHGYHAGNFADVVKHLTLSLILHYMLGKNKPIFYLETHAGRGIYDLKNSQATKTGEYHQGIELIWQEKEKLPPLFSPYLQTISKANNTKELRFYPGSACLAINLLRSQDRLYCCELHPGEFAHLRELPRQGKRVFYSHSDGLASLNALLPPSERRGLIFIDPSYEVKTDYKQVPNAIKSAYQRFATGIYCLWYPLLNERPHEQLLRRMSHIPSEHTLHIEFYLTKALSQPTMSGCGLWIINPPYTLAEDITTCLQQLQNLFTLRDSSFIVTPHVLNL
jgi:23S rRNA (adenine2030-N6)-methyltransferase